MRILVASIVGVLVVGACWVPGAQGATEGAGVATVSDHSGWLSVIPPILAIGLALWTRQVLVALIFGVWVGAIIATGNPFTAFLRLGDTYLVGALADDSHAAILMFSSILGGMVGILSRSGATEGIVHFLSARVKGRRGGQAATAAMGTLIFFDDYANTLLVGSTMRPLTDRLRISREKLSWLVDSTAAPVVTVALISTWVGFEVGLIQDAVARMGLDLQAYTFFLQSIPFSFYPLLTLLLVYLVAATGRDFGPMLKAERRALTTGQVLRPGARPASEAPPAEPESEGGPHTSPWLAGIPILAVILTTAFGIYFNGSQAAAAAGNAEPSLREILNSADSFAVLTWASLTGAVLAVALVRIFGGMSLVDALDGFLEGAKAMTIAVMILLLAWALSKVCDDLGTGPYLVEATRGVLSVHLLPTIVFVLAAAVSFATGTSWGTMAILMPLVFPLGHELPAAAGVSAAVALNIHLASVSAVLAGAVFGDHCSPISDTTILSSLASGADHIDHVKTQMPYALGTGLVAIVVGYLPAGFGLSPWISLALGAVILVLAVWKLFRPLVEMPPEDQPGAGSTVPDLVD